MAGIRETHASLQCPSTPMSGIIPVRRLRAECFRPGVYCTRCRFRMLPSIPYGSEQHFYCMECFSAVSNAGEVSNIISMLTRKT